MFSLFTEVVGSNLIKVIGIVLNGLFSFSLHLQLNSSRVLRRKKYIKQFFSPLFSRSSYELASQVFIAIKTIHRFVVFVTASHCTFTAYFCKIHCRVAFPSHIRHS